MGWFLYDNGLRHERIKQQLATFEAKFIKKWSNAEAELKKALHIIFQK